MPETQGISASRSDWTPPTGTLGMLVEDTYARILAEQDSEIEWQRRADRMPSPRSFAAALAGDGSAVAVIAEVKRRSPSKGSINANINAPSRAVGYVTAGAAAVSVLTEPDWFAGSAQDLSDVAAAVDVPVLRKDFIVTPIQLYEARGRGAAAALLIVRALSPGHLAQLHDIGSCAGLDLLVEVRDERELSIAIDIGAKIIGVNNRDLETLEIHPDTIERLIPLIPRGIIAVAESGMSVRGDIERAARFGADAVLVGSAVSAAEDPIAAVRALVGVSGERDVRRS